MKLVCAFLIATGIVVSNAAAQPAVSGVAGAWVEGGTLTVTGAGFGVKSPARPFFWADFSTDNNPSNLGIRGSWGPGDLQPNDLARTTNCPGQTGACLGAVTPGYGLWTAGVDGTSWSTLGTRFYITRLIRQNFSIKGSSNQNWKIWRTWGEKYNSAGQATGSYIAWNNGHWSIDHPAGNAGRYIDLPGYTANTWVQDEIVVKVNSQPDLTDGSAMYRLNGAPQAYCLGPCTFTPPFAAGFNFSDAPFPTTWNFLIHLDAANKETWSPAWTNSERVWVDDVYADTTWARVMVGNAATYTACTHLVPQIPTAWSSTSITVVSHLDPLGLITTPFLYVVDADGRVNSNGVPVSLGPTAPTGLRIVR